MIAGVVTAGREAVIHLTVRGPTGSGERVRAVIDTGFDGWLTLPPAVITRVGLPWRRRGRAVLADGRSTVFDIYQATVLWDRRRRQIPVDEADTDPLVGMALLNGYEVIVQVRTGGRVTLKPLSRPGRGGRALSR